MTSPSKEQSTKSSSPRSVILDASPPCVHAVTTAGDLTLMLSPHVQLLERCRPGTQTLRTLVLNRPSVLHALSGRMIISLEKRFSILESHSTPAIMLLSTPAAKPAFCAGGDIRAMHTYITNSSIRQVDDFFRTEFRLNAQMGRMRTPVVSIMDGLTMGGGAGLAAHGRFRVATENTIFAMPECSIGLICDVGATYFLPRLSPPGLGMYLALTGQRLIGESVRSAGFATHFVPKDDVEALVERLETAEIHRANDVETVLGEFSVAHNERKDRFRETVMRECFTAESFEAVVNKVKLFAASSNELDSKFALDALNRMRKGCPTSVKVVFEAQKRGAKMSLDECLCMEFRLVARSVRRGDFRNGVNSMVITKDRNPVWNPSRLEGVTDNAVDKFFAPLNTDLKIPELDIGKEEEQNIPKSPLQSRL